MKRLLLSLLTVGAALGAAFYFWPGHESDAALVIDPSCFASGAPDTKSGTSLDTFASTKDGVVYDGTGAKLTLKRGAGQFRNTTLGISNPIFSGCAGHCSGDDVSLCIASAGATAGSSSWPPSCERCHRLPSRE